MDILPYNNYNKELNFVKPPLGEHNLKMFRTNCKFEPPEIEIKNDGKTILKRDFVIHSKRLNSQ